MYERSTFHSRQMQQLTSDSRSVWGRVLAGVLTGLIVPALSAYSQWYIDRDTVAFRVSKIGTETREVVSLRYMGIDALTIEDIFLVGNPAFSYSPLSPIPVTLTEDEGVDIRVMFTPPDIFTHTGWVKIITSEGSDSVFLIGRGDANSRVSGLDFLYNLRFPTTEIGKTSQQELLLNNQGEDLTLLEISSNDPDASLFNLETFLGSGLRLFKADPFPLSFIYTPFSPGVHTVLYSCQTDKGIFQIQVTGEAYQRSVVSNVPGFALNTVRGNVGELITMTLRSDSALRVLDSLTGDPTPVNKIELYLQYNPESLWLQDVRPALSGLDVDVEKTSQYDRKIIIRGEGGGLIENVGGDLLWLDWIGLSTGVPRNDVSGEVAMAAQTMSVSQLVEGTVLLDGCTLGSQQFARRISVSSVSLDTRTDQLGLTYTAPEGVAGNLEVVDILGASRTSLPLERGSGMEQRQIIDLQELPGGFYALRIHSGDDVLVVPFFHP